MFIVPTRFHLLQSSFGNHSAPSLVHRVIAQKKMLTFFLIAQIYVTNRIQGFFFLPVEWQEILGNC